MPRSSDPRSPATREVRGGDTLTDIAVRSGVDPDALVRANPALVSRDLRPGDVINNPPEAATASTARSFAVPAAELGEDDPERGARRRLRKRSRRGEHGHTRRRRHR